MLTILYSFLHMMVDGLCALGMFGKFASCRDGYFQILVYNFCAFALQLPIGLVVDEMIAIVKRKVICPYLVMTTGVICTIIGFFTMPWLLGLGNALFHVGGGVGVIEEDADRKWKGVALGIFVAPGALGLFVGNQLAGQYTDDLVTRLALIISVLMLIMCIAQAVWIISRYKEMEYKERNKKNINNINKMRNENVKFTFLFIFSCFIVVVLRSYAGMSLSFPWKNTFAAGLVSVIAIVLGKAMGGILASRIKVKNVIVLSLLIAAVSYMFGNNIVCGIIALFCFNMTMPITLYLLVDSFYRYKGGMFGILTFGLFLGFLPKYFNINISVPQNIQGMIISLVSLFILIIALKEQKNVLS